MDELLLVGAGGIVLIGAIVVFVIWLSRAGYCVGMTTSTVGGTADRRQPGGPCWPTSDASKDVVTTMVAGGGLEPPT